MSKQRAAERLLPRGCYLIHHTIVVAIGVLGIHGKISDTMMIIPGFGKSLSVGITIAGLMGVYSRVANDASMEIIALRMMSAFSLVWGFVTIYGLISVDSTHVMLGLLLIAHSAVLWGLAQGMYRGLRADVEKIQKLMIVLFEQDESDAENRGAPDD